VFIFLGVFSLSAFAQTSEQPKNTGQNQKSQVNSKSSSDSNLEDTNWRLVEIKDYNLPELKRPVYLYFSQKDNIVRSSGLCNSVRADYKSDDKKNSLIMKMKPATLIGCDLENQVEIALAQSLKRVNRYEISDKNLYLYRGKTLLITLIFGKE
jgi:heat shock protein HslJ